MRRIYKNSLTVLLVLMLTIFPAGCSCVITSSQPSSPAATGTTAPQSPTPINPTWTAPGVSSGNGFLPDMTAVVEMVKPSVVAIDVSATSYDIFNRPYTQEGAGSGWILDSDGLIVTNHHVIEDAENITVTLDDGRVFNAETVASDELTDLAVLKIKATALPAVAVGDSSEIQVGMLVAAIGNALGQGISMKGGWVSRTGVTLDLGDQTLYDLLETDAAINPGNSGGPLVNMAGEVVGITSVKLVDVSLEGIGYAISTNSAMPIIEQLINNGYVTRPWLGVVLRSMNQSLANRFGLTVSDGALIIQIADNSPAAEAGLEPGDIIVSYDGKEITDSQDMVNAIHQSQIGVKTEIIYWRGSKKINGTIVPAENAPA
jgi:serine protease Do